MKSVFYCILSMLIPLFCFCVNPVFAEDDASDVCFIFSLENCSDQSSCEDAGGHWCSNACQIDACDGPSCSIWHYDLCSSQSSCEDAGGYWYDDQCNSTPEQDVSCAVSAPPAAYNVKMCDAACQASAPLLFRDDEVSICFSYSDDVDILMGFMSDDFLQVEWVAADCSVSEAFNMVLNRGKTVQCTVSIPDFALNGTDGWVFWFVSGVSINYLDWEQGAYDLLFEQTPSACEYYSGYHCIDCSLSCETVFTNDLAGMIDCTQWQADNCN